MITPLQYHFGAPIPNCAAMIRVFVAVAASTRSATALPIVKRKKVSGLFFTLDGK
jgi:hypothetical protein